MARSTHRRSLGVVCVVLLALIATACGSDGDTVAAAGEPSAPTAEAVPVPAESDGSEDDTAPVATAETAPPAATTEPSEPSEPTGPTLDASVLSGSATAIDGSAFDLGDLAGTDLVVWFWAPW